ncbi:hypothetical protein [Glutamicibacter sp.]|uniref:hypothetical protein n=1 Tax=Glutamicibacter sp. TaxID=1931995 RepID=UPI0028BF4AAA|nr:hypothetical protein [Glutamicibacter sp.]
MSDSAQRPLALRLAGLFSALFIIAGAILLWIDSKTEFIFYSGSYEPLENETFYLGPSTMQIVGEVLLGLGFAALCMSLGLILGKKIQQVTQARAIFITGLVLGVLFLVGGIALTVWDLTQERTFGWFAYAPLTKASITPYPPTTFALIAGKMLTGLGLGALGFSTGLKWELKERAADQNND